MKKTLQVIAITMVLFLVTAPDGNRVVGEPLPRPEWVPVSGGVTATVYHAVPEQCNADVTHTASMFALDPQRAGEYRILAMERTMMQRYGIRYGDNVKVTGAGIMDGIWRVEDTMSPRYAGQERIDFLVDASLTHGRWTDITVSVRARR